MISTHDLLVTAKYLVARDGAPAALNFASKGLQAMIDAGHQALIPDWQALHSLVQDAAMGRLPARAPTLH
ncbi:MAG: hypothetical protein EXR08_08390 [Alphaproteobacteria bacterium]|nr:hypothetical protein [Alphaproteobacteria bacterium]